MNFEDEAYGCLFALCAGLLSWGLIGLIGLVIWTLLQ